MFTDTSVVVGRTYRYKVVAVNAVGESIPSVVVSFLVAGLPSQPSPPSLLSQSRSSISVQWMAPTDNGGSDITSFTLYRNDGLGGPVVPVFKGAALSYVSANLLTFKNYRFQISATNQVGESVPSDAADFLTIQQPGQIGTPVLVDSLCGTVDGTAPMVSDK